MTTDAEREWVLRQNDMLPRYPAELYQRLRRCCICLLPSCGDHGACRAEFELWARGKLSAELERRYAEKNPEGPGQRFYEGH